MHTSVWGVKYKIEFCKWSIAIIVSRLLNEDLPERSSFRNSIRICKYFLPLPIPSAQHCFAFLYQTQTWKLRQRVALWPVVPSTRTMQLSDGRVYAESPACLWLHCVSIGRQILAASLWRKGVEEENRWREGGSNGTLLWCHIWQRRANVCGFRPFLILPSKWT